MQNEKTKVADEERDEEATSDATLRDLEETESDEMLEKEDENEVAPSSVETTDDASIESVSDKGARRGSSDAGEPM
jgi:hypothetical protein